MDQCKNIIYGSDCCSFHWNWRIAIIRFPTTQHQIHNITGGGRVWALHWAHYTQPAFVGCISKGHRHLPCAPWWWLVLNWYYYFHRPLKTIRLDRLFRVSLIGIQLGTGSAGVLCSATDMSTIKLAKWWRRWGAGDVLVGQCRGYYVTLHVTRIDLEIDSE